MPNDVRPVAKVSSITKLSTLASILDISESDLVCLADNVNEYHKPGKLLQKKGGKPRPTHDARKPLKTLHDRIKNRLLKQVNYPLYLLGGISDPENPRSCKQHAAIHCGKKILISEDIADFFPSTTDRIVRRIWLSCFNYSHEVADILTALTTYNGILPQGWKTSAYLANLVFWESEWLLVGKLKRRGISYSRFMDDITISSRHHLNNKEKTKVISEIYGMLLRDGFRPKRSKHQISSTEKPMRVTGLSVNNSKPHIPKVERKNIKTKVYQLEQLDPKERNTFTYLRDWRSVNGHVNRVKSFHPEEGKCLQQRMRAIQPSEHMQSQRITKK